MAMFKLRVLIINSETNINQSVWSLIGFWEIGKTNQNMGVVYAIYRDILATANVILGVAIHGDPNGKIDPLDFMDTVAHFQTKAENIDDLFLGDIFT